jgi:hypothetical protein
MIFCEKPMTTRLQDADALVKAVEQSNTAFTVNHSRRWGPFFGRRTTPSCPDELGRFVESSPRGAVHGPSNIGMAPTRWIRSTCTLVDRPLGPSVYTNMGCPMKNQPPVASCNTTMGCWPLSTRANNSQPSLSGKFSVQKDVYVLEGITPPSNTQRKPQMGIPSGWSVNYRRKRCIAQECSRASTI